MLISLIPPNALACRVVLLLLLPTAPALVVWDMGTVAAMLAALSYVWKVFVSLVQIPAMLGRLALSPLPARSCVPVLAKLNATPQLAVLSR